MSWQISWLSTGFVRQPQNLTSKYHRQRFGKCFLVTRQQKNLQKLKIYFHSTFSRLLGSARIVLQERKNVRALIYLYLKPTHKAANFGLQSSCKTKTTKPRLKLQMQDCIYLLITTALCLLGPSAPFLNSIQIITGIH